MSNKKKSNYKNPVSATLEGIRAKFVKQEKVGRLKENERLDGKTVLVDGASSGLGFATAVDLASRGAHVIMAARSGIPEKGEEVKKASGSAKVDMIQVDLSELGSLGSLCQEIRERFGLLDLIVCNAAMVARISRPVKEGLDEMFVVNYFAKFMLSEALNPDLRLLKIDLPADATPETPWEITRLSPVRFYHPVFPKRETLEEPINLDYRYEEDLSLFPEDSDVYAVLKKNVVSVTPINLDMTAKMDFDQLADSIEGSN